MEQVCHLSRGDASGAQYATNMFTDSFIHGWDIAKATGQDPTLDAELVMQAYGLVERLSGQPRTGRAYASEVAVPNGADLQTKVLGILGRSADWRPPAG